MKAFKGICIAFSIYSKIPMPQFEWKEEDMQYVLVFFPWIGAVIGGALYLWGLLCQQLAVSDFCRVLIGSAIPLFLSGGFHLDGYMDTMDALHSYQSREKKLEILKDSHVGAFAVIMTVLYYLIYLGAFFEVRIASGFPFLWLGFMMSRILSGLSILYFPKAKEEGSLSYFAKTANKRVVGILLLLELLLCLAGSFLLSVQAGAYMIAVMGMFGAYYYWKTKKEFGGITGDTAGFFVTVAEVLIVLAAALLR